MILPLVALCFMVPPQGLELVDAYPSADPIALTVDAHEHFAYSVEGSRLVELEIDERGGLTEARDCRLDTAVIELAWHAGDLFVAGGSHGLWRVELRGDELVPARIDDGGDLACTGVAADVHRLIACYAARSRSVVRVYRRADLALQSELELPGLRAVALALEGDRAALAVGRAGYIELALERFTPRVTAGARMPPELARATGGYVRDLAFSGPRVLVGESDPRFVVRVDAHAGRSAVGSMTAPGNVADGAPYGLLGAFGVDLAPGGDEARDAPPGPRTDALVLRGGDGETWSRSLRASGWRSLVVRAQFVYTSRLLSGIEVWRPEGGELVRVHRRVPRGLSAMDGVTGSRDPSLVVFGDDSMGAVQVGCLRSTSRGFEVAAGPAPGAGSFGLFPSAPVAGPDGREWLVGGKGHSPSLFSIHPSIAGWPLTLPEDEAGARGHTYFSAAHVDGWTGVTRAASRQGFLLYATRALTEAASGVPAGSPIEVPPLGVLDTHALGAVDPPYVFRVQAYQSRALGPVFALAAGMGRHPAVPEEPHARLLLVRPTRAGPERVAAAVAEHGPGNAVAIDVLRVGARDLAALGDLGGFVTLFDVTEPAAPVELAHWTPGPHSWDAAPDPILDLEWIPRDEQSAALVVAAGRRGLGLLRVGLPGGELELEAWVDTPGWAVGVHVVPSSAPGGRSHVLLGDQKAGLRRYRVGPAVPEARAQALRVAPADPSSPRVPLAGITSDLALVAQALEDHWALLSLRSAEPRQLASELATAFESAPPEACTRAAVAISLQLMLARLGDGHTRTGAVSTYAVQVFAPFLVGESRDGLVAFHEDRSGLIDAAHPFLTALDGRPVAEWLELVAPFTATSGAHYVDRQAQRNLRYLGQIRAFGGLEPSPTVTLTLRDAAGATVDRELPVVTDHRPTFAAWPRRPSRLLPGEPPIGYLRLPVMDGRRAIVERYVQELEDLRGVRGLIVDVRGNGGGTLAPLAALLPYFLDAARPAAVACTARQRVGGGQAPERLRELGLRPRGWPRWSASQAAAIESALRAGSIDPRPTAALSEPHFLVVERAEAALALDPELSVVLLVDGDTYSASDVFAAAFAELPRVTVMGTRTGGGFGAPRTVELPATATHVVVSEVVALAPDGRPIAGEGLLPDVELLPDPEDFTGDSDRVLEAAVAFLRDR